MAKALVYVSSSCTELYKGSGAHMSALCALTWKMYLERYPRTKSGDPAKVFQLLGWCVPSWLWVLLLGTDSLLTTHFFPCKAFLMYFDTNTSAIETLWFSQCYREPQAWFNQALEKQTWRWLLLHRWQEYCTPTSGWGRWCIRRKNMSVCYLNMKIVFWKSIFKVVAKQRWRHFILFASSTTR